MSAHVLERTPEPSQEMSDVEGVHAFDAEGAACGSLVPVYYVNALNMHRLVPPGGTVLDLGSGSGRLLAFFARCRPDVTIIGTDLSDRMVSVGNQMLRAEGLHTRVCLRAGDMTNFCDNLPSRVDLVSSIFALHHLPSTNALEACLRQLGRVRKEKQAAVWLFDYVRPKRRSSAEVFPEVFTPRAPKVFRTDSTNSLIASWRFDEIRQIAATEICGDISGQVSRLLPLFQMHWIRSGRDIPVSDPNLWYRPPLSASQRLDAWQLARLFHESPSDLK